MALPNEIPVDFLISDLERAVAYPISPEEIYRSLQYLRRANLVSIDWREGKIRREKAMKDYVDKYMFSELWHKILDDWRSISAYLKARYGRINQEYNYPVKFIGRSRVLKNFCLIDLIPP